MNTTEMIVIVVCVLLVCCLCSSTLAIQQEDQAKQLEYPEGNYYYGQIPASSISYQGTKWTIQNPEKSPIAPGYFAVVSKRCHHCHQFMDNAQEAIKTKPFTFVFMEGDDSPEGITKAEEMGIRGFPTIFSVMKSGELLPYNGSRSADALAINSCGE